jgi:hypothetical protein
MKIVVPWASSTRWFLPGRVDPQRTRQIRPACGRVDGALRTFRVGDREDVNRRLAHAGRLVEAFSGGE